MRVLIVFAAALLAVSALPAHEDWTLFKVFFVNYLILKISNFPKNFPKIIIISINKKKKFYHHIIFETLYGSFWTPHILIYTILKKNTNFK